MDGPESGQRVISVLTIAGSDSGGGAGIQADLKTFAAHDVHGVSAISALTAQHTRGVTAVHVPPMAFLRAQIDACFADFDVRVVKLGMLANAAVIDTVIDALHLHGPAHVVLDPVMVATSGAKLLDDEALDVMRTRLLPLASLVTPNGPEAALLTGLDVSDAATAEAAITRLRAMGARAVLLKGGHVDDGDEVVDRLDDGSVRTDHRVPRRRIDAHGTGCTLAASVAAHLARGATLSHAVSAALDHVQRALEAGYAPGKGDVRVLDSFAAERGT